MAFIEYIVDASVSGELGCVKLGNQYVSFTRFMVDFFYQAVGRQWKQWCSDHEESKSPTDVVSSYCRVALNFIDL